MTRLRVKENKAVVYNEWRTFSKRAEGLKASQCKVVPLITLLLDQITCAQFCRVILVSADSSHFLKARLIVCFSSLAEHYGLIIMN
jgi:hypothetical protein